jgi:hypothetical protein
VMPIAFFIGVHGGPQGMAWAWLAAFPLVMLFTAALAMPIIGVSARSLARSVGPGLLASAGMALVVLAVDRTLPPDSSPLRLAVLVATGVVAYGLLVLLCARSTLRDVIWLVRRRNAAGQ